MTTAVSGTPVRPGKTFELSVLDHAMAAHNLRLVYYYRSQDMKKLRDSLTEVLSSYPAVTGRLRRRDDGNWEVTCSDAGVRILEAKIDVSLDEWLRSARPEEEMDLTHWEEMPENPYIWSPFYIQVLPFVF